MNAHGDHSPLAPERYEGSQYLQTWTGEPLHRRHPRHRRALVCCGCYQLAARHPLLIGVVLLSVYCALFGTLLYLCIADKVDLLSALGPATSLSSPSFTPLLPPSYPLAVGNPYLSAWLPGRQAANLPSATPQFWNGQQLGWSVIARVNDKAYSLFGVPSPGVNITEGTVSGATFTTTHSTFLVDAGPVSFALDFFAPVSPNDYIRQSLPFNYLTVSALGRQGISPSVQVYSDIDSSWTGHFEEDADIAWNSTTGANGLTTMTLASVTGAAFSEVNDMAQWGTSVYCSRPTDMDTDTFTHAVGDLGFMRSSFTEYGEILSDGDASTT